METANIWLFMLRNLSYFWQLTNCLTDKLLQTHIGLFSCNEKGRLAVFLPSLPILRAQHKSQRLTEYMDSLGSETAFTLYKLTVNGCICGKWVLNFKKKQDKKPAPVCSWAEASCNTSAAPLIMALFRYYTVWARARAMWTANTELRRKYSHWGAQINHVSEMRWRYRTGCL